MAKKIQQPDPRPVEAWVYGKANKLLKHIKTNVPYKLERGSKRQVRATVLYEDGNTGDIYY